MMSTVKRSLPAFVLVAVFIGAIAVFAQQSPPAQQAPQTAQGELQRVDNQARILVVRTASAQMQFHYTSDTKVTGAEEGVAGLATMAGSQVTVQYIKEGQENIAQQIAVQPKK
jgi:hypothetical protein